jgi:hypothetical protein
MIPRESGIKNAYASRNRAIFEFLSDFDKSLGEDHRRDAHATWDLCRRLQPENFHGSLIPQSCKALQQSKSASRKPLGDPRFRGRSPLLGCWDSSQL